MKKLTFILFSISVIFPLLMEAQSLTNQNNKSGNEELVQQTSNRPETLKEAEVLYEKNKNNSLKKKQYVKEIEALDKAIKNNVNNTTAYYKRGLSKTNLGNYTEAIKDFSNVIKRKKGDSKAYLHRGKNYYELENYAKAIDDYETAIALNIKEVFSDKDYTNYRKVALNVIFENNKAALDANKILFFWINESEEDNAKTQYQVNEPYFPIKLKLISNERLKNTDFNIYVNGELLEGTLEEGRLMSMDKVYTFKKMVKLKDGQNLVEVEVNGQRSTPLDISYQPQKPKLYVLSATKKPINLTQVFESQGDMTNQTLFRTVSSQYIDATKALPKQVLKNLTIFNTENQSENLNKKDVFVLYFDNKVFKSKNTSEEIANSLNQMPCKKLLFVESSDNQSEVIEAFGNKVENLTTVITKTKNQQLSELINTALTGSEADENQNKIITTNELIDYVKSQVTDSQVLNQYSEDLDIYLVK